MKNLPLFVAILMFFYVSTIDAQVNPDLLIKADDFTWVPPQVEWPSIDTIEVRRKKFPQDSTRRVKFVFWSYTRNAKGEIVKSTPSETMWIDSVAGANVMYQIITNQAQAQAAITYLAFQEMNKTRSNLAFASSYRRAVGERLDQTNWKLHGKDFIGTWALSGNATSQTFNVNDNGVARRELPIPQGEIRNQGSLRIVAKGSRVELYGYLEPNKGVSFDVIFTPNAQNGNTTTYMSTDGRHFLSFTPPQK